MVYELSDARDMTIQEPSGGGYIIFNRQVFNDPRYKTLTSIQRDLLIHCIVNATYLPAADKYFGPIKVTTKRGQLAVTLSELQNELGKGVTRQNVRSALKRLEQLDYLTCKSTNKYTLVTVENYDFLVNCNEKPTHNSTQGQHTSNTQATIKNPASLGAVRLEGAGNKVTKVNKENNNIIILSHDEQKIFDILGTVANYPIDRKSDLDMIKRLKERYPQLDLVESISDWAAYKLDKPLRAKDNPRSQINTSCKNYVKWGKNIKQQQASQSNKKVYE